MNLSENAQRILNHVPSLEYGDRHDAVYGKIADVLEDQAERIKKCRANLALSVCKECKCKANTKVNEVLLSENTRLREALKE